MNVFVPALPTICEPSVQLQPVGRVTLESVSPYVAASPEGTVCAGFALLTVTEASMPETVLYIAVSVGVNVALNVFVPTLPTLVAASSCQAHPFGRVTSESVSPYVAASPVGTV